MNQKVGRNDPCPCGSGKKYKKCCLGKVSPVLSIEQLCQFLEWSLKQQPFNFKDADEKINVKSVKILNNMAMSCEFYPYSAKSADIKTEIAGIMAFMASFLKDNPHTPEFISDLSVAAFSSDDEQIMYAMTSREVAEFIAQGKWVEWLNNTLFQDNSEDFRQSRAKTLISEIENALRKAICDVLSNAYGTNWWDSHVPTNIKNGAQSAYQNQTGASSSTGTDLIHFTYLLQLKAIIVQAWAEFTHIFPVQVQFEQWINDLNQIRRDEAHNRPITSAKLRDLEQIYLNIMDPIARTYPLLVQNYLVHNWHLQLRKIAETYSKNWTHFSMKKLEDLPQCIADIKDDITVLKNAEIQLSSVVVPVGKNDLHNDYIAMFCDMKNSLENVVKHVEGGNFDEFQLEVAKYDVVSKQVTETLKKLLLSEL